MKKRIIYFLLLGLFVAMSAKAQINAQTKTQTKAEKAIRQVLAQQTQAWNEGSLENFMAGYWQSDSLKFIGKRGISYGWQTTLENYKKSYPDKTAMGYLTFEIVSLEKTSNKTAFVIGKWKLKREKDELQGYFTLFWRKINGKWLIVADHSS
jgi:ketosteroid isomerase-like protein